MKKILLLFILCITLSSCSSRNNFYVLEVDDYSIAVGADDVKFLKIAFDINIPEKIEANQSLENIDLNIWNKRLGEVTISNEKKKEIDSDKALLTNATFYLEELGDSILKIDGIPLSKSVKENCNSFNGTYIERNGYACVIEKDVGKKKNTILFFGNIYNIDQDQLDRIEISIN